MHCRLQVLAAARLLFATLLAAGLHPTLAPAPACAQTTLAIAPRTTNTSQVQLSWPSQVSKQFSLWATTNLTNGFDLLSRGLQATPPQNLWWADRSATPVRFFRQSTDGPAPRPPNLVTNGDFSNGLPPWITVVNNAVGATLAVSNGQVVATIGTNAGTPVQIQLIQTGIPVTNGRIYTLQFQARSSPLSREIDARVTSTNAAPRTNYLQQDSILITPAMTTYTTSFTMTNPTDPAGRLVLNFGGDTNDVVLDNVAFYEGEWFEERAESHELARRMGTGNNFMAAWAIRGLAAPEDAALLNRSGFSHMRIGYKMNETNGPAPNYAIPPSEMQQLQDIVDYCLAQGLIAVVDPASNWANGPGYSTNDLPELQKIWQQVAAHFAGYPVDMVLYEILNEPHDGANVSNITATILATIRAIPGNEKRQVLVSGEGFSTRDALIAAFNNDWIPSNDPYLIGTFHYYDPREFTKQGDPAGPLTNVYWGAPTEIGQIDLDFEAVTAANHAWALRHGTERLPIYLGEFGVDNFAPPADRKRWLARVRMAAQKHGFACAHWAMYNNDPDAKGMGPWTTTQINNPATRAFDADPLEALMTLYQTESQTFSGGVTNSSAAPGFTGTGYALFPASTGTNVYCEINGYIPTDDAYTVKIRYASPAAPTLTLKSLNNSGAVVQSRSLLFPATGGSTCWAIATTTLNFQAGENARLRIIADAEPGPAVDYVRLTR
jgi:hypothetical protein